MADSAGNRPSPPLRVLVVDDYPEMRALIRVALDMAGGFEVVAEAGDVEEAIEVARQTRPDAVILDVMLPGRSGPSAISEIVDAAGGGGPAGSPRPVGARR